MSSFQKRTLADGNAEPSVWWVVQRYNPDSGSFREADRWEDLNNYYDHARAVAEMRKAGKPTRVLRVEVTDKHGC